MWEIGIIFFKVLHELDQCAGGHRIYIRKNVVCLFIEYRSMFWGWPKIPLVGCIFAHNPFHYVVKAEQENITFWLKYSNMSVKIWSVVHVRHNCMWMKYIQNLVFFLQIVQGAPVVKVMYTCCFNMIYTRKTVNDGLCNF